MGREMSQINLFYQSITDVQQPRQQVKLFLCYKALLARRPCFGNLLPVLATTLAPQAFGHAQQAHICIHGAIVIDLGYRHLRKLFGEKFCDALNIFICNTAVKSIGRLVTSGSIERIAAECLN